MVKPKTPCNLCCTEKPDTDYNKGSAFIVWLNPELFLCFECFESICRLKTNSGYNPLSETLEMVAETGFMPSFQD